MFQLVSSYHHYHHLGPGPTLTSVAIALVAGEAGALVAADVVGAVRKHITGSEKRDISRL